MDLYSQRDIKHVALCTGVTWQGLYVWSRDGARELGLEQDWMKKYGEGGVYEIDERVACQISLKYCEYLQISTHNQILKSTNTGAMY